MRRLSNDVTGGAIAGCPTSAAAVRRSHVDLCWFLAHATFSFARDICGLSWPTLLFGSKCKKPNSIIKKKKKKPFGPFWVVLVWKLIISWNREHRNTSEHLTALGGYPMTAQAGGKRRRQICRKSFGDYNFTETNIIQNRV